MPSWDRRDAAIALLLAALAVIVFYPLTLQGHVLASFDALAYFYPHAVYLAERLRAGQIPLWDPLSFAGVPFLANSQVGALYPPSWLYLLGPVSRVYSWLVVGHVWLLAIGMYLLARGSLGLRRNGAVLAAIAAAFSGFVGGMSGHVNQVEALAWAPFAVLLIERAVARAAWRLAVLAAVPFTLGILAGHSQVIYLTGVMAGAAGVARVFERRGWAGRFADLARLAVGPLLGILIAAAQLLPTLELTRQSIRATGLSFDDAAAFSLPPPLALTTLLPTIRQPPATTEWIGYVGLVTLALAGYEVLRRPRRESLWLGGLAVLGLLLAFGRFTPLYALAFTVVPGFDLFRVPARWLTLWVFAIALLAGRGLDALIEERSKSGPRLMQGDAAGSPGSPSLGPSRPELSMPAATGGSALSLRTARTPGPRGGRPGPAFRWGLEESQNRGRRLSLLGVALALGTLSLPIAYHYRAVIARPSLTTLLFWLVTAGTVGLIIGVIGRWKPPALGPALIVALIAELGVASLGLPLHDAILISAVETPRAADRFLMAQASPERVLALGDNSYDPGDLAKLRAQVRDQLTAAGQAEYINAIKHADGLTPNLAQRFGLATIDGYDGGVLPLSRYRWFKQLFAAEGPDIVDGRLRIQLKAPPDPRLLGWLNVRYLLMDRLRDKWLDGHYYDLAVRQEIAPEETLRLATTPAFTYGQIGVVLAGTKDGPPFGRLRLRAGTFDQILDLTEPATRAAGRRVETDFDPDGVWLWHLAAPAPMALDKVTLQWDGAAPITLRSLTAIAPQGPEDRSISASASYHVVFLDDMKIYTNDQTLPRAFLARGLTVVPTLDDAVSRMRRPDWDARGTAIVAAADAPDVAAFETARSPGTVQIVSQAAERWEFATATEAQQVLVMTDADYPGWRAQIDGREVPILPVNVLFRGIVVPPGAHRITVWYDPPSWRLGLLISGIGGAALLAGWIVTGRSRQLTPPPAPPYTRAG